MSDADLNKLKVTELKEELKKRGIDTKGNKAQLIQKLKKALKEERNEGGAEDSEGAGDASLEGGDLSALMDSSQYDSALESSQNESNLDTSWNKSEEKPVEEKPVEEKPVDDYHVDCVPAHFVGLLDSTVPLLSKVISATELLESTEPAEPEHVVPIVQTLQPEALLEPATAEPSSVEEPVVELPVAHKLTDVQPEAEKRTMAERTPKVQLTEEPAAQPVSLTESIVEQISEEVLKTEEAPMKTETGDVLVIEAKKEQHILETVELEKQTKDAEMESTEEKKDVELVELEDSSVVLVEDGNAPEKEADEKADVDMEIIEGSDSMKEKRGEKRRRSRSRSRSPDRHRDWSYRSRSKSPKRGRHSRSRSKSRSRSRSRSRDRSQSQERRQYRSRSRSQERQRNLSKSPDKSVVEVPENEDWITSTDVQVDRYNCDLSITIDDNGLKVTPLTTGGFAYMWHGVKSTYGVSKGKTGYEVKILEHLTVDLPDEEESKHVARVGFSIDAASTQLGEEKFSYGYGGTGKASTDCKFTTYGNTFEAGDVIGAYVDFEGDQVVISFTKNGEDLGTCFEIPADSLEGRALFPHVLTKNCSFECNFGQLEEPFFPVKEGFTFLNVVPEEDRVRGTLPPAQKEDCEMIMMCGLPGSGKTSWAAKHTEASPDKRYTILGTNSIIDKMKVMGLPRKRNYAGRWDVLIDLSTKCLNRLLTVAARKKRNFILDQTNVYPSAQRRKMRPFEGFQRTAVVIVPTDEEFKRRCEQREKEEGKEVPDSAVLEMKANFQLPTEGSIFDKVQFVELEKDEAQALVEQYNREGKQSSSGGRQYRGNDRNQSYDNRSNRSYGSYSGSQDRGRDNQRSWGYNNRRGERGGGGGGGYYNRDNRDGGGYNKRGGGREGGYGGSGGYSSGGGGGYGGGGYRRNDRGSSGGGGYNQPDRRRDQSSWSSGGGYRDRRDNRGSSSGGRDTNWGGNRSSGYQQQQPSSWKSQGNQGGSRNTYGQGQQGSWGNQGSGSQTGSWGAANTATTGWGTQQDWSQQAGYQQPTWGQWTPYSQQPQQQQQVQQQPQQQQQATAAWNQQYWNSWNAYNQAQQGGWDYSQYSAQGGAQK